MNYLSSIRKRHGASQQEVADYLGVTRQAYGNYETSTREPDFETLLKLGEFFGVSIDEILRGEQKEKAPAQDEGDIEAIVDSVLSSLSDSRGNTLMMNGRPASPKAVEYLRESIRANIEHARRLNEEEGEG